MAGSRTPASEEGDSCSSRSLTVLGPYTHVQLLRSYASDLYNPQVATVLGIILDITTTDCQSMAETQSREPV